MAPMLSIIWWRDIPAQVVAKDARRSSKVVLHPRFQVAIDKAANRASACGPATTPTGSASGGLLRKARPSTAASTIGNTKTQNTASGSRVSSWTRARVSSRSGPRTV